MYSDELVCAEKVRRITSRQLLFQTLALLHHCHQDISFITVTRHGQYKLVRYEEFLPVSDDVLLCSAILLVY